MIIAQPMGSISAASEKSDIWSCNAYDGFEFVKGLTTKPRDIEHDVLRVTSMNKVLFDSETRSIADR